MHQGRIIESGSARSRSESSCEPYPQVLLAAVLRGTPTKIRTAQERREALQVR